jgi:hypothetical protein
MKKIIIFIVILGALFAIANLSLHVLTPWMDRWGANEAEAAMDLPGDEFVPSPARLITRAIDIKASPEQIYPWLVQIGADKGGWYSYDWLETLAFCRNRNAGAIHPEWQGLDVGDEVKMCPGKFAPPPYVVAQVYPNRALVLGHQENDRWVDAYQFVLLRQANGTSRLLLRTRTLMEGGFWKIMQPVAFVMEQKMLRTLKQRVESLKE